MTKEKEISQLLSQGAKPADLVRRGFSRGSVYKTAKRLANDVIPHQPAATVAGSVAAGGDADLEADPEILELKKDLRKAQLQRQLAEVKGLPDLEERLQNLEFFVGDLIGDRDEQAEAIDGSPLSGLRQKFSCPCGAGGLIAAKVACTVCGQERAFGWFPKR